MADEQEQNTQPEDPTGQTEQYLFYNVMPKVRDGGVVAPTVTVTEAAPNNLPSNKAAGGQVFWEKYKKWILIGVVAVVIIAIAFWAYEHFVISKGSAAVPQALPVHHATTTPQTIASGTPQSITTPTDWQTKYFGAAACKDATICGDSADPDHDGATNLQEYKLGTDPNHADSDNDDLADGDEVNVFLTNPLTNHTGKDKKYTDADNLKNGYDFATDQPYTQDNLQNLISRIKQFGLHEPTVTSLGEALSKIYHFDGSSTTPASLLTPVNSSTTSTSSAFSGLDQSPQAKQDRDAQRTNTMQTIATVLLKYQFVSKSFPTTNNFANMYAAIKPYNLLATNPVDPINKDPFVYGYTPNASGSDFTLSFYSETQNQIIKITSADAQKYAAQQAASNNDDQRKSDLESLQSALLLYSSANAAGNQDYVFPTQIKYKSALMTGQYITGIPVDPVTHKDYDYEVSSTFDTFTLKAVLQNPPTGSTGYMCNQLDCGYY